jgi:hypothetical protein
LSKECPAGRGPYHGVPEGEEVSSVSKCMKLFEAKKKVEECGFYATPSGGLSTL